jgi:hypothetical protein
MRGAACNAHGLNRANRFELPKRGRDMAVVNAAETRYGLHGRERRAVRVRMSAERPEHFYRTLAVHERRPCDWKHPVHAFPKVGESRCACGNGVPVFGKIRHRSILYSGLKVGLDAVVETVSSPQDDAAKRRPLFISGRFGKLVERP